jgi:Protein of unknown function (DUF2971)
MVEATPHIAIASEPMKLYHYCSNAAFLSIISGREIWLSELSLSNDAMEGVWIRKIFHQICVEKKVPETTIPQLLDQLDLVLGFIGGCGLCMSEEGDLLSQWRAYASDGAGVSLGFNREYLEELGKRKQERNDDFNLTVQRVEYDLKKQVDLVTEHVDEILGLVSQGALSFPTLMTPETPDQKKQRESKFRSLGLSFLILFPYIHQLKNPAFAEEREWRATSHILNSATGRAKGDFAKMEFRPLADRIIPYRRIAIEAANTPPIFEIILGPRNLTPEKIVEGALQKHGWKEVTVRRSSASYR